jgi:hypothetical protein
MSAGNPYSSMNAQRQLLVPAPPVVIKKAVHVEKDRLWSFHQIPAVQMRDRSSLGSCPCGRLVRLVAAEAFRPELRFRDTGGLQRPDDSLDHGGRARDQVGERLHLVAQVVTE